MLTSIGFGTVSAIVPIVNAEAYVIASQMSAVIGPIPIAIGIAIGQTVGKLVLSSACVRERELLFRQASARDPETTPVRRVRARFRAFMASCLTWWDKALGLPIVLVAAIVGIPPLYAVALLAGATTMKPLWFGLTVLVGRLCRFLLVASGFHGLHEWFV